MYKYYAIVYNENTIGVSTCPCSGDCREITKDLYDNAEKLILLNNEIVIDPEWDKKQLNKARENKKAEASKKAYEYIANGAMYEFESGKHIEANDGNISKLGLAAVELVLNQDTESTIDWCTVEDEIIKLNAIHLQKIVQGLKTEQSRVWVELYPEFLRDIELAQTLEEVNSIKIDYAEKLQKMNAIQKSKTEFYSVKSKIQIIPNNSLVEEHSGGSGN